MTRRRTRAITTSVTEEEYALFETLKGGTTVSEWAHDVLLRTARSPAEGPVILAELLAVRALLLNLVYKLSNGTAINPEQMQQLIDRADAEKVAKAQARLAAPPADRSR